MPEDTQTQFPRLKVVASPSPRFTKGDQDSTHEMALTIARVADERKGGDIILLRVSEVSYLTDYFVIVTGFSKAQVRAIHRAIEDRVEEQWQRRPVRVEGQTEGNWILQDYGDVIVHVLMPKEREFYNLEAFWGHAERVDFATDPASLP